MTQALNRTQSDLEEVIGNDSTRKRQRTEEEVNDLANDLASVRRIASKHFFVTITQLDEKISKVLKINAHESLQKIGMLYCYVIGEEQHLNRKMHHHIYMQFEEKVGNN